MNRSTPSADYILMLTYVNRSFVQDITDRFGSGTRCLSTNGEAEEARWLTDQRRTS